MLFIYKNRVKLNKNTLSVKMCKAAVKMAAVHSSKVWYLLNNKEVTIIMKAKLLIYDVQVIFMTMMGIKTWPTF